MNEEGGEKFKGMMRFDARIAIEEELKKLGLYRGKEDNKMQLPLCSRSKDVIEPRLKPQWWVSTKEMSKDAAQCVRDGKLRIIPDFHKDTWYRWLDDCRDWCISRQLWWGHRIPHIRTPEGTGFRSQRPREVAVARTKEEALARPPRVRRMSFCYGSIKIRTSSIPGFHQPISFSTMGWPNEGG